MRLILLLLLALSLSSWEQHNANEMTTYYFIRHAEKDTSEPSDHDPELIEPGRIRAEKWRDIFQEVPLDMVYSSKYKRAHQTAKPVADDHDLPVSLYNTEKLNDRDFQQETKGKTVLVVGHSNLNPEFVNYIIEEDKYDDIPESEHGSLFVVTVTPSGKKQSHVLYIN